MSANTTPDATATPRTIEQAAQECLTDLECNNYGFTEASAVIADAMREVCAQAIDNWDDIEIIMAERDQLRAQLRERTQWQCKCGGTDCAGMAENERLRAEVERLKAQDGFHWNIIKGCMDELEMVDMGPSMIRGEIQEWKCSHERVKAKEVAATDRAVLLAVERDQLRARAADLENDLEKSKHEADDWHRAWETVTEQAKKEVTELDADKARLDWLEQYAHDMGVTERGYFVTRGEDGYIGEGGHLRAAIDAARAGKGAP